MAATPKVRLKQKPDVWSVRERLALACSVARSGDQNWVSVSRAIRPFGEPNRSPDWFSQKNCALQYADLLEKVETPKRKRQDRGEVETPGSQISRKLTIERIEELKKLVEDEQEKYKRIKDEVELIKSGALDDKIKDMWEQIQKEKQAAQVAASQPTADDSPNRNKVPVAKKPLMPLNRQTGGLKLKIGESISDHDDTTQESLADASIKELLNSLSVEVESEGPSPVTSKEVNTRNSRVKDEMKKSDTSVEGSSLTVEVKEGLQVGACETKDKPQEEDETTMDIDLAAVDGGNLSQQQSDGKTPSPPILSSLLQKNQQAEDAPGQVLLEDVEVKSELITEGHGGARVGEVVATAPEVTPISVTSQQSGGSTPGATTAATVPLKLDGVSPVPASTPTLTRLLETPPISTSPAAKALASQSAVFLHNPVTVPVSTDKKAKVIQDVPKAQTIPVAAKTEPQPEVQETMSESTPSTPTKSSMSAPPIDDEPLSPASSIVSNETDAGSIKGSTTRQRPKSRLKRGRPPRASGRLTRGRKEDEESFKSDSSDDETIERESDADIAQKLSMSMSESVPNSPASICPRKGRPPSNTKSCGFQIDTEEEKNYKAWKKSIMLVWRAAATHKFANVFLHPVTEDIAPGYATVVNRPMDLTTIKKHVENGTIRTTDHFQRDMMLMFTNALMYNSSDQSIYKMATEMYNDIMANIEQYVNAQLMVTAESKMLRTSRRSDIGASSDKEEDPKKRKSSLEPLDTSVKKVKSQKGSVKN